MMAAPLALLPQCYCVLLLVLTTSFVLQLGSSSSFLIHAWKIPSSISISSQHKPPPPLLFVSITTITTALGSTSTAKNNNNINNNNDDHHHDEYYFDATPTKAATVAAAAGRTILAVIIALTSSIISSSTTTISSFPTTNGLLLPPAANAAPPFAIMAEELGYFPVIDERSGSTVLVPAKIKRHSTPQAIELAKYLQQSSTSSSSSSAGTTTSDDATTTMYGAYWCPHCSRQKEVFGIEAYQYIHYVECDPRGYRSQYATCIENGINGYPTWKFGNGKRYYEGEMELIDIAKLSGFLDNNNNSRGTKKTTIFDASLELGVPPLGGASSCQ